MIQFHVLNGPTSGASHVVRKFPFLIGRLPACDLSFDEPGVWDRHLEIHVRKDGAVEAVVPDPALAAVNGESIQKAVLRNGDVVELGALRLRFALSPARQRSMRFREVMTWVSLGLLCAAQLALIYWLVS